MAGALATAIYFTLEENEPGSNQIISTTIATFAYWLLGEHVIHRLCLYFNLYTKPNSKNPLYRNVKTLSNFGTYLGVITAALSNKSNATSAYSALISSMIGLLAFIIHFGDRYQSLSNIDAQIGTEGWSKYAKTALVLGASMGQFLGGIISYLKECAVSSSAANITLYGAIAAVASFVAVMVFVPLINYVTRTKSDLKKKGIFVTENTAYFLVTKRNLPHPKHICSRNKHVLYTE